MGEMNPNTISNNIKTTNRTPIQALLTLELQTSTFDAETYQIKSD